MDSILINKIILALGYPMGLIALLLACRWLLRAFGLRGTGGFLGLLAFLIFVVGSNPLATRWLASTLEHQYPQRAMSDISKHDAILILGGGLGAPLPPSQHTQIGSGSDRYLYALRLFRAGKADTIVITGGAVFAQKGYQGEAYYGAELLQMWGVPKNAIVIETNSRTTLENRRYTEKFLADSEIESVLLVTSAIHMPRAYRVFESLPQKVTPAPADILIRQRVVPSVLNWIPSAAALQLTTRVAHEYYGMWFSEVKAWIESGS